MTGLFLFCLIAGGALTAVFAFAGDGDGDGMLDVLPLSSVTTALGVFGAAGLGLQSTSVPGMAAFGIATGIGVVTGGASIAAFRYLRRSSTTSSRTDKEMEGSIAQVVLPITAEQRGKIALDNPTGRLQMTAEPIDDDSMTAGDEVVVVAVRGGVALVASLRSLPE